MALGWKETAYILLGLAAVLLLTRWLNPEQTLANGLLFLLGTALGMGASKVCRRLGGRDPEQPLSWAELGSQLERLALRWTPGYVLENTALALLLLVFAGFAAGSFVIGLALSVQVLAQALQAALYG